MSSIEEDIRAVMHEQAALLADMKVQVKQLKSKLETAQKELQKARERQIPEGYEVAFVGHTSKTYAMPQWKNLEEQEKVFALKRHIRCVGERVLQETEDTVKGATESRLRNNTASADWIEFTTSFPYLKKVVDSKKTTA